MMNRDYIHIQVGCSGMTAQMGARPQGQPPQYPPGAQQQMIPPNQQMMMGDQAMNHSHMQQQQQYLRGMMSNGMTVHQMGETAPMPLVQDPGKRKLIQQQLVLLLHAHKCQQRERNQDGTSRNACTLPHCSTMKEVLQHMITCNNGRQCSYPHCVSSRQIINHWKNCEKEDCPVCRPLKNIQASAPIQIPKTVVDSDVVPQNGMCGGRETYSLPLEESQSVKHQSHEMSRVTEGKVITNPTGMEGGSYNGDSSHLIQIASNVRQQLLTDCNLNEVRPLNGVNRVNGMGGGRGNIPNWPPAQPTTIKSWHAEVSNDLRHNLVEKLLKTILPYPDPAAVNDDRIKDVMEYARKTEQNMFENASDREEYYHLLAEKIYKIQKELQEKKQKRLSESRGGNGFDMGGGGVKSEIPGWSEAMDGQGPSTSGEGMGMSNGVNIKKEEIDDTTSSANGSMANGVQSGGGWNPSLVKEEPSTTSHSASSTPHPSTSANVITPKKEPKRELTPPNPPGSECIIDQMELRSNLEPILIELDRSDDAVPFTVPVDPYVLGCPDYFDIIKHPMDLSTIYAKLQSCKYTNPWQFCDDMWLMFDNAWMYNKKNSKVYKMCCNLSRLFVELINPVMENMGYCCGEDRYFTQLPLFCYGATMCTIGRDQPYYCYETTSNAYGVVVSDRYTYCVKCYDVLPEKGISVSENPNDKSNMVAKNLFKQYKNNVIEKEPFENCKYCHRKFHKICVLYDKNVYPEGFVCNRCREYNKLDKQQNKYSAKQLAKCQLSDHLEDRVNRFIRRQLKEEGKEVIIRVLSAVTKEVEVKPMMKSKYCGDAPDAFPHKFPYTTKAIFAFEIIDGVEVCFFGLHVQEYGSKSGSPNQRRVYIAYLDSVHYFEPKHLRTDVYHEILLGYLDYARKLGYTMAHIWACPPSEGDDYIFHCHPTEQKIPKPKRLQDWYKKMLDKGVQEQCVVEYKDIYKQARDDGLTSPADLPYFEGDFWPNVIEDCIREASSEEAQRKKEENEDDGEDEDLFTAGGGNGDNGKKKGSKSKKNNLKKSSTKSKKKAGSMTGNEVTDKLYAQLEKHKEVFFTIRLVTQQSALSLTADIEDPDGLMSSELMDGRDTFLTRAREEHWEFSSLRRAKYSTLCLAHALHVQEGKGMEYTCNQCDSSNAHWHCATCDDFDLCDNCKVTVHHEHPLNKVKTLLDEGGGNGGDGGGNKHDNIQKCIQSLVHACTCRDANCRRSSCFKMKRVVSHTKQCKKRTNATCPVCKQLIVLCCYHAKHCQKEGCQVPFCMNIRQKLMEQKRSLARRADMMMRRRMEGLSAVANANAASSNAPSTSTSLPSSSNPNPPSTGPPSMLSSTGGPSSVSSMSSHNMKGGGSGTAINPAIPSSSTLHQSHPSPMDQRNSKFGGQATPQSSYQPGMSGSVQSNQVNHSSGMGMMGTASGGPPTQYGMTMANHPQMAPAHIMSGKPTNAAMMRGGMDGSGGMGGYRQQPGTQPPYGGMGAGMMGAQSHPMHSMAMRQQPAHDPNSVAAVNQQRILQQQQQQQQRMGQQGLMGQQGPPPMVSSKPGEDGSFR
ncbi:cbp-1 [Pristionchus pacificus]|uniref:histone acetyltransferase n=1 Tax=Pristionchus pacificus TaxID=54126 RepID=A0A2A6CQZ1_PRIPA|nr:cbp-1 [Pristionchus pacificus]|eukprot:PDM80463.1 hypothetical protein PRIPAC_35455 [Pristionchus pacificus]